MEAVEKWLERAEPDVLLMQETKLADARRAGDAVRGWPATSSSTTARGAGTASPSRPGLGVDGRRSPTSATGRSATRAAGAASARRRGGLQPVRRGAHGVARCAAGSASSACTRPTAGSWARRSTRASCAGSSGSRAGSRETRETDEPLVLGGDFNVTPRPTDVWERGRPTAAPTSRAGAGRVRDAARLGPGRPLPLASGRSPAASRGGTTGPACSTRTRACASTSCYATAPVAERVVWAEIDREARKGPPIPSDHAPVVIDLDEPGKAVRRRLGGGARADLRPDEAPTLTRAGDSPRSGILRGPRPSPEVACPN